MSYEIIVNQDFYEIVVNQAPQYTIEYSNERGPQGPPGTVPDDVVREWNDPTDLGTDVVVGMIELKLWDSSAGQYRDIYAQEGQLQFDNDVVAIEDNAASTLRRGAIMLYDSIGDGDYVLEADNSGLIFNGFAMAPREDHANSLGTQSLKIWDVAIAEWSELTVVDGLLQYTSLASGFEGTRNVVVNVNKTNDVGDQKFEVIDPTNGMLQWSVQSQNTDEGFLPVALVFNAEEGFNVTQGQSQIVVSANFAMLKHNIYTVEVSASGYTISQPAAFRKAINAPSKFHVFALGGI